MPPEPSADDAASAEVEELAHTLLTALTVAKGRAQLTRRLAARPVGVDPVELERALAAIDRAVTMAAMDAAALIELARGRSDGRRPESAGGSGGADQVADDA